MNRTRTIIVAGVLLGVGSGGASPRAANAQNVGARINAVTTGTVRVTYTARDGVCGDGMSWYRTRGNGYSGSFMGNVSGSRDVEATCNRGPVRLVIVRENGVTTELRTYVGGRWKADTDSKSPASDLGAAAASDMGTWLLALAESGDVKPARSAITAATLADSVDPTATLLRIVKNESRPTEVRSNALNWLGEVVGEHVSATLDSIAYEPGDREVRMQAIYAISRRPADEAVPALLKMAETLPDRELRRTAVQWLVRSKDPRAVQWVERRLAKD